MNTSFKVLVSAPKTKHLSSEQEDFLQALKNRIVAAGLQVVDGDGTLTLEGQAREIRNLQGVVAVAFLQWDGARVAHKTREEASFPTEFTHLHMAMAAAAGRPLLVLREKSVTERGALRPGLVRRTVKIPASLDPAWLATSEFDKPFQAWLLDVNSQSHVFFAYSGAAGDVANKVQLWLLHNGLKVLDWKSFRPAESIFSRIEQAADQAACGLFLFTADDVKIKDGRSRPMPRDNVVFEAGYFARAKGKERTLIILEGGVELLADLGGDIYLKLGNRADTASIEGSLLRYFDQIL